MEQNSSEQVASTDDVFRMHDAVQSDNRPRVFNPHTGRMVVDTEQAWKWREDYYKRIKERKLEDDERIRDAAHRRNLSALNILGTKQVAEELKCSQATAWNLMREREDGTQIIPSFRVGRSWLTHAENVEEVRRRGREYVNEGFADRTLARLVWKVESGRKW